MFVRPPWGPAQPRLTGSVRPPGPRPTLSAECERQSARENLHPAAWEPLQQAQHRSTPLHSATAAATGFYLVLSSPLLSSSLPVVQTYFSCWLSRAGPGGPRQVPVSCDSRPGQARQGRRPGQSVTKLLPTPTAYSLWRTTSQRAQR